MEARMAAFGADVAGARDEDEPNWALPNWEEYSEASRSSFVGDWSDVEPDVSVDTASSVASTEYQRVYRLQRARGGAQDRYTQRQQRDLTDLHSLYARRRREERAMDVASGNISRSSSSTWFQPAPCVSPRVAEDEKPLSPIPVQKESEGKTVAQRELLAEQSEISAQLQAVRRQLSDFQDKWKQTVDSRGSGRDTGEMVSDTPTASSSWSAPVVTGASTAVQTDEDGREDAVKQWLLLLTQELDTLAGKYSHEPTLAFQAAMTHLNGLQGAQKSNKEAGNQETSSCEDENEESGTLSPSSWQLGRALKTAVSLEVAEQFLELERAVAGVNEAVEQHERRQLTNFDRAVRQVQGYHHERLQRVVDESLAELKLVRGRYKNKESQLEEELRVANKAIERWKQSATEAEHRKKLGEETMTFQFAAAKEQYEHACRRNEEDTARLKNQLESLRAERLEVADQRGDVDSVISQATEKANRLEEQHNALVEQQERAKELHDHEQRVLRDMIRQLREDKDEMEARYARERETFTTALEELKTTQQGELKELEARVMHDTERRMLQELLPEKISSLEKRHEESINSIRSDYEQKLARLAAQLDESKSALHPSIRVVEIATQTEAMDAGVTPTSRKEETKSTARIDELTRRCQALEKLLDKKFEETPRSLSSSRQCESCHSDALSSSGRSSIRSDSSSVRGRASGKSRALARALLGSSRSSMEGALFPNETTLATEEATLGAHEMWDTSSFTSADTMDDLASFTSHRTTPRPQGTRSTQEILTLVRKLKQTASSTGDDRREPDPEVNWGALSKQKHAMSPTRDPPSWGGESRGNGKAASHIDASASDAKGTSIFDDLLASHSLSPTIGHADAHHATR